VVRLEGDAEFFPRLQSVQTGDEAILPPILCVSETHSLRVKLPVRETEVEN
jgi:hypothetical protein